MFKKIHFIVKFFLLKTYVEVRMPWLKAKLFIAWDEYHQRGHYRERVSIFGAMEAYRMFKDHSERNFYFKRAVERDPALKQKWLFHPFTFEAPDLLTTLAEAAKA